MEKLELDLYPTTREFRENGFSGAYQAIRKKIGGNKDFAAKLGIQHRSRDWTQKELKQAVRDLIDELGLGRYPQALEFQRAGLGRAYKKIHEMPGGHRAFSKRLGCPVD